MSVATILRRQHGVISRKQARTAGLTDHQVDRLIKSGEWIWVRRGVFRHQASPATWRARIAAAVIATQGVASHRCAAALWGLELIRRPQPEVTVSASRRTPTATGIILHRTSSWSARAATLRHGISTTGIERTLLDCAGVVSHDVLERLAESAIRQRATSWSNLEQTLASQGARGRNGTADLRSLIDRRLGDPVVPHSDFSRGVVQLLEHSGIEVPRLEYPVRDDNGRILLLADLAWPARMRIVELDGLQHHFSRADRETDIEKRAEVRAAGWRLLEVGWKLYNESPDQLVALLRRFLR